MRTRDMAIVGGIGAGATVIGVGLQQGWFNQGPRAKIKPSTLNLEALPETVAVELAGWERNEQLLTSISFPSGLGLPQEEPFSVDAKGKFSTESDASLFVLMRQAIGIIAPPAPNKITFRWTSVERPEVFAEATLNFVGAATVRLPSYGTHIKMLGLRIPFR